MPKIDFPGLPAGYQVRRDFNGRKYVLLENKNPLPLIIAEFEQMPGLYVCLKEINAWEEIRANIRGENGSKL